MLDGIILVMEMSEGTYHGREEEEVVGKYVQGPPYPSGFSTFVSNSSLMGRSD